MSFSSSFTFARSFSPSADAASLSFFRLSTCCWVCWRSPSASIAFFSASAREDCASAADALALSVACWSSPSSFEVVAASSSRSAPVSSSSCFWRRAFSSSVRVLSSRSLSAVSSSAPSACLRRVVRSSASASERILRSFRSAAATRRASCFSASAVSARSERCAAILPPAAGISFSKNVLITRRRSGLSGISCMYSLFASARSLSYSFKLA
mmetsp:Transcript_31822/g.75627  ORF Transcript_31822/g.75627 Transcript_31822/m.75627 type:complete len:212 (-) Transcript_31822:727-1362(-)